MGAGSANFSINSNPLHQLRFYVHTKLYIHKCRHKVFHVEHYDDLPDATLSEKGLAYPFEIAEAAPPFSFEERGSWVCEGRGSLIAFVGSQCYKTGVDLRWPTA